MSYVNMHEAKSNLSKLVEAIESGAEVEITIARNGHPAARLVPVATKKPKIRLGLAEGKYVIPDDIDRDNAAIASMFQGENDD